MPIEKCYKCCNNTCAALLMSTLRLRYDETESINDRHQVAALEVHDVAVSLHMIHTQYHDTQVFMQGSHRTITKPWQHMWRQIFKLDTVIGMTPSSTTSRQVAVVVLAETLLGCRADPEWIICSPEACSCLWLLQLDTNPLLAQSLQAGVAHPDRHTTLIIVFPGTHPSAPTLTQWHITSPSRCSAIYAGTVNTLLLLRDHDTKDTTSAKIPMTAYRITGATGHLVSINDVVSHVGCQTRANTSTFPPPPPARAHVSSHANTHNA